MSRRIAIVALLMALTLSGCLAIGGSNKTYKATVGQELIDLKAALDVGAINQAEYDMARQRFLGHAH